MTLKSNECIVVMLIGLNAERQAAEPPASGVLLAAHVRPLKMPTSFSVYAPLPHNPGDTC
jgi:hypothetical protein